MSATTRVTLYKHNLNVLNHISAFSLYSRLSTIFTILSLAIIFSACLFTLFGHCLKGGKMLVASGLYAFGGGYHIKICTLFI